MRLIMTIAVLCLTLSAGCISSSVYVLDQAELIRVKKDQTITIKYDGFLFSDRAVTRVLDAKIKKVNLE